MKNVKNIAKGLIVFSFLALLVGASPASAKNEEKDYLNARAGLKAEALVKLDSVSSVIMGANGAMRVLGAKVVSVSENVVRATVSFGESVLNFVINIDADTKVNGDSDAKVSNLEAGDKISFSGALTSSTSSSLVVDADHLVSRELLAMPADKTSWSGEIKATNDADNSFTLGLKNGRSVKVAVSSSTAITLDGAASNLAALDAGDEVKIEGTISSDSSVISATKIKAESEDADDDEDEEDDEDEDNNDEDGRGEKERGGWFWKIRQWFSDNR